MSNDETLQAVDHLIGTPYSPDVKEEVKALTGLPRVVGIGEVSTTEYDPERIHIHGNPDGMIMSFTLD